MPASVKKRQRKFLVLAGLGLFCDVEREVAVIAAAAAAAKQRQQSTVTDVTA